MGACVPTDNSVVQRCSFLEPSFCLDFEHYLDRHVVFIRFPWWLVTIHNRIHWVGMSFKGHWQQKFLLLFFIICVNGILNSPFSPFYQVLFLLKFEIKLNYCPPFWEKMFMLIYVRIYYWRHWLGSAKCGNIDIAIE